MLYFLFLEHLRKYCTVFTELYMKVYFLPSKYYNQLDILWVHVHMHLLWGGRTLQ